MLPPERVEHIDERHVVGNLVIKDAAIHELHVGAAQASLRSLDVFLGDSVELAHKLDPDHPLKREPARHEHHSTHSRANVDEDVVRPDLETLERPTEGSPAGRDVVDAVLVVEPDLREVDLARGADAITSIEQQLGGASPDASVETPRHQAALGSPDDAVPQLTIVIVRTDRR